ncbi:MAG: bifunctional UDP-N-acetylmuramoyl-tripeptide:D-alanyl-D-alanine ligase/alanine racemase [Chitinophagaceae bacterium]
MINTLFLQEVLTSQLLARGEEFIIDTILTDSRKIVFPQTALFVCLVTNKRNAHQFIQEAYAKGVRSFIVSEAVDIEKLHGAWIYQVSDTLMALQQLAIYHSKHFDIPTIGITGSNGKTIVKELLNQLLEPDYRIVRSPKSYNSQLGVALSVWQKNADHNLALFEAGISMPGEMERLEKMIRPTTGIFTTIGEAHNDGFLNNKHKITEKLKLFTNCKRLFYNKDFHELHECILQFSHHINTNNENRIQLYTWSYKYESDLQITRIDKQKTHANVYAIYQQKEIQISLPFLDNAYIEDVIPCWLLMLTEGYANEVFAQRCMQLSAIAMRLELKKGINYCTLINDSYSADISSLTIALDFLTQQKQHSDYCVILSDILQSGRENELYEEIASLLEQKKIRRFIGIGEAITKNKSAFRKYRKIQTTFFPSTDVFLKNIDTSSFNNETILIKGARKFEFEKIAARLEERIHQTVLEINLNALLENLYTYKKHIQGKTKIMAMVKAFSYGSGSFEIANKLQYEGINYLAVAYTDEGIELRKKNISLPIMVMNPDINSFSYMSEWNLEPEIYNFKTLERIIAVIKENNLSTCAIHLKLDTGMHRLGFDASDIAQLIQVLNQEKAIKVLSVFSHLSGSEEKELDLFTIHQANEFTTMCTALEKGLGYSFIKHICNSSGIVRHPDLHFDMVRLGLGLYGIDSSGEIQHQLKNVSTLKSIIAQIKHVPQQETVGYNRKGVLDRDTRIGTVCIGYADGISRQLGNGRGKMLIHGQLAPIVGNVCMDMCMLDITDIPDCKEGDEVIIFGKELSAEQLAKWAHTIPYEILTNVSQRVKRIYYEE